MPDPAEQTSLVGRTLSHYRVVAPIGEGGMGRVFLAHDEQLDRDVAIKLLPEGALADERERERFRRAARAVARVIHPNVGTIFDFGTEDGRDFLVMELVQGETLAERIGRGPLAEDEIRSLGAQIADALEASHELGVAHRDLKPANVIVTGREQAKVLDFGVAKLLHRDDQGGDTLTRPNEIAGSLPYMAPEQFLGSDADERADLYALGVVLFEMATGRRPHFERSSTALMYAIAHTPPPAPRALRPELTPTFESIVLRLLEKAPEARPVAREAAAALRGTGALAPPPAAPRIESIAVLPFENLSGDPAQEFFADGMTDEIITRLAQIGALRVISRTTAMQYKGARTSLPEIARVLHVDAVVEGAVARIGDRVRVTAQLIEAATDRHLWVKRHERAAGDVLALQDEIAQAIADGIRVELSEPEQARLAGGRPVDPRAYEAYLKGRYAWSRRTAEDLHRALEFFQRAIELDPGDARAYAGVADVWSVFGDFDIYPSRETAAHSRAAAQKALALDPQLAEALTSMGFVRMFYDWDWPASERLFRQSLAVQPGYSTGLHWYSELLVMQGQLDEALATARRAQELDPLAFVIRTAVADALYFGRHYDEAVAQIRTVIELEPDFLPALNDLGRALAQRGDYDAAIAAFHDSIARAGGDPRASGGLGHVYALAGRHAEAREIIGRLEERVATGYPAYHGVAVIHAALGDVDHALDWLELGFEQGDRALVWMAVHPRLDPVRGTPRFSALLRRMRLPEIAPRAAVR